MFLRKQNPTPGQPWQIREHPPSGAPGGRSTRSRPEEEEEEPAAFGLRAVAAGALEVSLLPGACLCLVGFGAGGLGLVRSCEALLLCCGLFAGDVFWLCAVLLFNFRRARCLPRQARTRCLYVIRGEGVLGCAIESWFNLSMEMTDDVCETATAQIIWMRPRIGLYGESIGDAAMLVSSYLGFVDARMSADASARVGFPAADSVGVCPEKFVFLLLHLVLVLAQLGKLICY